MDEHAFEHQRIQDVYDVRNKRRSSRFFNFDDQAHVCSLHERYHAALVMLAEGGFQPLSKLKILDVGCGDGPMLRQFLQWGAASDNLAGLELRQEPVDYARRVNPGIDVRCGSAVALPWQDGSFDIVCQHTMFTSILDPEMKRKVAGEMTRVLRRGGGVLWYDFRYDNPWNKDVRGVKAAEIKGLFPGLKIRLQSITLVPPLARRLPRTLLPLSYAALSAVAPLRTHYLGLFSKP